MKIVICTTPIRPTPTDYPPVGSMAVISALQRAGVEPYFYDIDGLRPSFEEVTRFFTERKPDVVGISAVVSTAYAYTKQLVGMIKAVSPRTRVILGGNLAASSEILHRLAGIDYCVVGEGEIVSVNLMGYLRERGGRAGEDFEALARIKGISYIGKHGEFVFTGYETRLSAEGLYDPDYSLLERYSRIENFIRDPMSRMDFALDPRSKDPHRQGKKMATLLTAKGCVARCTFCHRWDKGYRAFSVDKIVGAARRLIERYNVGYLQFGDENFGSDRRQVSELIEALKPLDILYQVGGVRCRTVDPDLLRRMKESGCVSLFYGMETGSPRILEVMEKNASLEHNMNAARWTHEADLFTIYQLILGMPGESPKTVEETAKFFASATETLPESPINRLSINYIQALPGTPVYEYARHKGLIGSTLEEEEKYLLLISDIDAADDTKFINFTDYDYLTVQSWRRRIILECVANYRRKNALPRPGLFEILQHTVLRRLLPGSYERLRQKAQQDDDGRDYNRGGYFNLQRSLYYDVIASYLYAVRTPVLWIWLLAREFKRLPFGVFLGHLLDTARGRLLPRWETAFNDYRSLRKVVDAAVPPPVEPNALAMAPLRAGR